MDVSLRPATPADVPAVAALDRAVGPGPQRRPLHRRPGRERPAARLGVDTQLLRDGTYFVIEADGGLAAAGGWSRRRTLYGGDQTKGTEDPPLDPAADPARYPGVLRGPRLGPAAGSAGGCSSRARRPRPRPDSGRWS